jgi:ribonuclease BN (tRNA processing enzyme)
MISALTHLRLIIEVMHSATKSCISAPRALSCHADLAEERGHTTAAAAAQLALEANVKLLALTHYSPRYEDGAVIINEALSINPNTILARDLMRIKIDKDGSHEVILPSI